MSVRCRASFVEGAKVTITEFNRRLKIIFALTEFIVSLTAAGLAWYWYGWHATVIVFLVLWAANLRQAMKG
jgi:hypothetical protein